MKYFKRILLFISSALILFILYIEVGGKYILSSNDKQKIVWNIKNNDELPKNFITFYNTVYENSLTKNSWSFFLEGDSFGKKCPCFQMTHRIMPQLEIKKTSAIDYIIVTRYIEQNYSQTECLKFNFSNFDFLEKRKGIEDISKSLFNKSAKDLKPIEMGEILAVYEKPVKNNRNRNPESAKKRSEHFYRLYLKNLNK